MANRTTNVANFWETTLTATFGATDLIAQVASSSGITSPALLVINPDVPASREVIYFDGTFTGTTLATSALGNRYLSGSAAGSGLSHSSGAVVRSVPLRQHIDDINDRVDAHAHGGGTDGAAVDHGGLAGLGDDDHAIYVKADGTRAMTGDLDLGGNDLTNAGTVDGLTLSQLSPSGVIAMFGGAAAPSGWLLCDGAAVSRATYAALFGVIGTTYGVGDGSTTFNLPNMEQRFPLGKADSGTGAALGETGGAINHAHSGPSHTHTMPTHIHTMPTHTHADGTLAAVDNGSHSHTVNPAATDTGEAIVGGNVADSGSSGLTSQTVSGGSALSKAHTHSVDIASTLSSTVGHHDHVVQGDTAATDPGDTNATDPGDTNAGGTGNTGTANPPYLTVNFIIKA